ncbi:immunoglobulin domain-containing protein [Mesoterricola silvestris]|uniref:immunoglobulin domain-containing protein n=1 Tax=Mesoterricola silvestris TaxID=2927979 RepID=UPI00292D33BB|nr:immunoglobulin domain-containing protein [Mesoterricola silvestris]
MTVPALAIGALALPVLFTGCSSSKHDPDAPVAAPVITAQPANVNAVDGGTATLSVTATGDSLSYQWRRGGASLLGKTSATLTLNPVATTDAGSYTVVVTNTVNGRTATTTSAAAVLSIVAKAEAPVFTTSPAAASAVEGGSATFNALATGNGTVTYQWLKGGTALVNQTGAALTISPVTAADAGSYTVTATNTLNGTTAATTSAAAVLTVLPAATVPVIGTAPAAQTVLEGDSATFTVAATGNGALSYQWLLGGVPISGKTNAALTLSPVLLTDAGDYTVTVTNTLNGTTATATSAAATLTVTPKPVAVSITAQPQPAVVTAPAGATFSVTATGNNLSYAWKDGSGAAVGTDSPTLTVAATDLHTVSNSYTVTVTSGSTHVVSDAATLTVSAPKPVYAGDPTVTDTTRPYTVVSSFLTTAPADPSGSFRVGYDTAKLSPVWSSACFFPSAPWTFARPSDYPTDPRIAGSAISSDYSGTGYSRGHQTQFANLRDVYGPDAGASTMYMTNMCPQVQALNGGVWGDLETLTTQTLTAAFGRVWIYTGPIFSTPLVAPISAKNIPIATAFYKILVRETPAGPKVLALIVPHSTTVSGTAGPAVTMVDADLWKFATTVDRVQELTGLNFFPAPASPLPATFTSVVDVTGWGNTLEQGPNRPNVHIIKPSWDSTFTHVHNTTNAVTTIATSNAMVGDAVPFEGQATADPDAITGTTWNFGDGSATVTTPSTTHVFTTAGSYTASFTATDALGHTSTLSRVVTITSPTPTTPTFTTQPQTQTVFAGNAVFLSAAATGNGTVTYQWQKDSVDIPGATAATLKLTSVTTANSGTYTVIATNTSGSSALTATSNSAVLTVNAVPAKDMYEGFETGAKTSYTSGVVALGTGSWTLTDALLASSTANGGSTSDHFLGLAGVRLRNSAPGGKITMGFDWALGAQSVSVKVAKYGSEAPGPIGLFSSVDGGTTWVHVLPDATITSTTPTTVTWTVGIAGSVRFELRRMDATNNTLRSCIDDFYIVGY